jgi:hypothetical protein
MNGLVIFWVLLGMIRFLNGNNDIAASTIVFFTIAQVRCPDAIG